MDSRLLNMGKNIDILRRTTERYNELMTFLHEERNYNDLKLFIGTFEYDDWIAKFYCILEVKNNTPNIYFLEKRNDIVSFESKFNKLTDLCFGWGFDEAIIDFDLKIIDNFYDILSKSDKYIYDSIIDEVHCNFW